MSTAASEDTAADNPWLVWQQSIIDEGIKNLHRASQLPGLWEKTQKIRKGVSPSEVVYEEDRLKIIHYLSSEEPRHKTPLMLVFALVNRPYILDLKDGRSVVQQFVKAGYDVYLVDWGVPTLADRHLTLDDYINGYLVNCVDFICERCGVDKVTMMGYCMGGTMATMFTALHQDRIRNLILLTTGIDFETRDGLLNAWADPQYFDIDAFVDAFGNCPAEFLQASFLMLNPVQNIIAKPINFIENVDNEKFVDDFLYMETWLNDNISVPGEVFREFVKYLFQQNLMVKNKLPVGKHIVNLKNIKCPLLNLIAQHDHLVPPCQSLPLNDLVSSNDRKSIVFPAGHIGLSMGSKAQRDLWPTVTKWLAERD